MPRSRLPFAEFVFPSFFSTSFRQIRGQLCGDSILDFCVGDGTVLLSQVKTQLALVAEMQVTLLTMVGLLSSVNAEVALERLEVTETCSADFAGVWFLPCMDQNMGSQVSDLHKSRSARLTFVWLFS